MLLLQQQHTASLAWVVALFPPALATTSTPAARHTRALLLHKPVGLLVTHRDELGRPTVYDLIRAHRALCPAMRSLEWHACGRLDQNSSGLLLMTNDGQLVQHVTDPSAGSVPLPKKYRAVVHQIGDAQAAKLREGVELSGGLGVTRPADVRVLAQGRTTTEIEITICEGRNRQVRRMLHAVGSGVMSLERVSVGGLSIDTMEPGDVRLLDDDEIRIGLQYMPRSLMPKSRVRHGGKNRRR
ncbi:hypothetical protein AB1Y20_017471 [Prymnesium parvum]|uniref:Pseudouridine synthase RsuA/RluA-like domain-containing protein n=1 Tax=Prymnesium parvum TaxID=97485 RepID=A0AB34JLD5_PRYPA